MAEESYANGTAVRTGSAAGLRPRARPDGDFVVLVDPDGNRFCVVAD